MATSPNRAPCHARGSRSTARTGLLTRRGEELLRAADVVVYDRLASHELLDLAPDDAERVDVGKEPGRVAMSQDEINAVLVDRGRQGRAVVRLKGELDCATAPQREDCLRGLDGQTVTFDFSDVTFLDSSGIGVLVRRYKSHGPHSVVVRGVAPAQMRVLEITGLVDLLDLEGA